jgi:hypothetical protein
VTRAAPGAGACRDAARRSYARAVEDDRAETSDRRRAGRGSDRSMRVCIDVRLPSRSGTAFAFTHSQ